MAQLYCLTFPNGKMYVGQSKCAVKRYSDHAKQAASGNRTRLYTAWRRHGAPLLTVLWTSSQESILKAEFDTIRALDLIDAGYNMIDGGASSPMLQRSVAMKVSTTRKADKNIIKAATERIQKVNSDHKLKDKIKTRVKASWLNEISLQNRIKSAKNSTKKRMAARGKTPCTCNGEFFKTVGAAFIHHNLFHPHSAMVRQQIQRTGTCTRTYDGKEYLFKLARTENEQTS